jgi:hypothetical protein
MARRRPEIEGQPAVHGREVNLLVFGADGPQDTVHS